MKVQITREADDPLCLRASIGGTELFGYYLMFRGDPAKIRPMLREVLEAFDKVPDETFRQPS